MPTCGPLSGAFGLEAGMDLYWSIPAMTQDLGFYSLCRKIVPFITKFIASYNRFPTRYINEVVWVKNRFKKPLNFNICNIHWTCHCMQLDV